MITALAHINLTVPPNTLPAAHAFYAETLGLTPSPVPAHQRGFLAWFDIGAGEKPQQIHIATTSIANDPKSSRHPCFRLESPEKLIELRERIWSHFKRGGEGAPLEADEPGSGNSGEFLGVLRDACWLYLCGVVDKWQ